MAIILENISFAYPSAPDQKILKNISVDLGDGELIGIIGKTGVGKSTLLKICTGFLMPDDGKIYVNEEEIRNSNEWRKHRSKTGLVFQFPEKQLFEETVFNDIAFSLISNNLGKKELKEKVYSAMKLTGLSPEDYAERSPWQLSSGEQRKAAIAGIIAMEPEIIFLDEPTLGIDQIGVRDIENLISRLSSEGITVCIVSHNMDFILRYAERIIVLYKSGIVYDGDKNTLFNNRERLRSFELDVPEILILANELKKQYGLNIDGITDQSDLLKKVILLKNQ